jgi:hypothetical protein
MYPALGLQLEADEIIDLVVPGKLGLQPERPALAVALGLELIHGGTPRCCQYPELANFRCF